MAFRLATVQALLWLAIWGVTGCGKMVVVGEVDGGGGGADGDTDTDVDTDTDIDTDTDSDTGPDECTWHTFLTGGRLNAVWGVSADAVFAVGGTTGYDTIVIRYDGTDWGGIPGLESLAVGLEDVWGTSANDVFVACEYLTVLYYDGALWYYTDVFGDAFYGIWGSSANNVFAVGGGLIFYSLVFHFDGDTWSEMSGVGGAWLNAVWGSSASDVYAVGYEAINHFDGSAWSSLELEPLSLGDVELKGVWGSSSSNIHVVGRHWSGPVMLHFDDDQWTDVDLSAIAAGADLRGVHGNGPDDVWVVGAQQFGGIALRFDGSTWSEVGASFPFPLDDVWVAPSGEVFAVGDEGVRYCVF